jgi:hypothetical protein
MKHLLITLLILGACAAGFFVGRMLSKDRCPPPVTVQLQNEIEGLHSKISLLKLDLQKIREQEKAHE